MNQQQTEALRVDDRVEWRDANINIGGQAVEWGRVVAIEPDNHYILIEWDKDGARSHLDTRDCEDLFREDLADAGRRWAAANYSSVQEADEMPEADFYGEG